MMKRVNRRMQSRTEGVKRRNRRMKKSREGNRGSRTGKIAAGQTQVGGEGGIRLRRRWR